MPQWESLQKRQPVQQVRQFGTEMKAFGERHGVGNLTEFGEQLLESLITVDIARMRTMLHQFPELVQQIRSMDNPTKNSQDRFV